MRGIGQATWLSLLAATGALASDVIDLKADTFKDFIKENDLVLAEFFAPWCGHCKALAPEYEEAATSLKEKNIALAKVDCTEESDLCRDYGVDGYPTVKVFRGLDNIKSYSGARKAPAIVSYMIKQSLPAVSEINADNMEDFKKQDKVVLVAYVSADDKANNESYTQAAELLRDDFLFGATSDAALAESAGVKQPGLVMYKDFDDGVAVFDQSFTTEAIEEFARTASVPLVGQVSPETYSSYMATGLPLTFIFGKNALECEELASTLKPVAQKYRGKINFATLDASAYGQHASNLNLDPAIFPALAIHDTAKNEKFPFDQTKPITEKAIEQFAQDYLDGKIEPSIKSEPIPEAQDGPVSVVVAHTYHEIVLNNDKDVLVEFYAPWCGHCKALAPKYEELGQLYKAQTAFDEKVTIAKIDATANDVPEDISGFPTIKLYPAGDKDSPVDYSGARTVEDLAQFVKEHGKHHVDVYEGTKDGVDGESADAGESMASQAPAATGEEESKEEEKDGAAESLKSAAAEAAEAVRVMVADTDDGGHDHDEL